MLCLRNDNFITDSFGYRAGSTRCLRGGYEDVMANVDPYARTFLERDNRKAGRFLKEPF
jgi:hypothetical protein